MKLARPAGAHLTYCTNIHPGHSWPEVRHNLETHVADVKRRIAPDRAFGVGLRLSASAARELTAPAALEELRAVLADNDLYVFTINGFPYGSFHGERVKENVYRPDWLEAERVDYSNQLASLLVELLPEDTESAGSANSADRAGSPTSAESAGSAGFAGLADLEGTVSTVPVAYRPRMSAGGAIETAVEHLLQHAAHLVGLHRTRGRVVALALEPEPCCYLETVAETVSFFERHVFGRDAVTRFGALTGLQAGQAESALRRHLGVCLDTCHAAVEFEDPAAAVAALAAAGIRIAKVQLSTGLHVAPVSADAADSLEAFAEDVYLHQVVEREGSVLRRYTDLPEALRALRQRTAEPRQWRIHFHVPLFLERLGTFENTQPFLREILALQVREPFCSHLEVETYTWEVLPAAYRDRSVDDAVARELGWVLDRLQE